jgi:hypothetical protein
MTLEWGCSFDHQATADLSLEFTLIGAATINSGSGQFGTNSLRCGNSNRGIDRAVSAAATKCAGFWLYMDAIHSSDRVLLSFYDGSTKHVDLRIRGTSGNLFVTRNGTQLGSDSSSNLVGGVGYWIEMKALIADSGGTIEVRVNGTSTGWISLSSQDTRNGATAQVTVVRLLADNGSSTTVTFDFDDLVIADDFLGPSRIACLQPTAEGTTIQLTPSSGTDNSALVDDATQDGDSTYVEHATDNNKDTYVMENLPSTAATVHGVIVKAIAKKDDAGAKSIALVARHSGSETDSADKALGTTYAQYDHVYTTKPGGGAWASADVDGMENGIKVRP